MKKKKILVTGGAGFVGSHLCEALAKDSDKEVFSLDNYFTGSKKNHVTGVNYIEGEVKNINSLINFRPTHVYHLGEYSRVEQSFDDIETVWDSNKNGIISVLQFCRNSLSKLIYAGSSTKFGDGGLGRTQSPYAWTKATNTELVMNYGEWFNLEYAIVYFYNVYGKREISAGKYATLIGLFKDKMKSSAPLTVVKPGTQRRNFTHINDIISGLQLVGEKGKGDGYGIGHPSSFSILEIAKMFGKNIEFLPERKGNRMDAEIDISKTQSLGWGPKMNISEYVEILKKNSWDDS